MTQSAGFRSYMWVQIFRMGMTLKKNSNRVLRKAPKCVSGALAVFEQSSNMTAATRFLTRKQVSKDFGAHCMDFFSMSYPYGNFEAPYSCSDLLIEPPEPILSEKTAVASLPHLLVFSFMRRYSYPAKKILFSH